MDKMYTPNMTAKALHVSPDTVKNWLRTGKLKGIKAGRQWRIREEDLALFIQQGLAKEEAK